MAESFSWSKFFSGFSSAVGWVKAAAIAIRVAIFVCVPLSFALTYHFGFKAGDIKGQTIMAAKKEKEFRDWIESHPQNVVNGNGTQLNNNVRVPNNHFQASVFPFRLGWCE